MTLERDQRRKAWLTAALLSAALLVVPLLGWLLLPGRAPFAPPPAAAPAATPARAATAPPRDEPDAPHPAPAEARPAKDAPVRGVVLDPQGKPVAGAFVGCNDNPGISGSTDTDGRFELPPDADGCLAVATQALHSPSEPARLASGRDNTLRLTGQGAIEGAVVDEQGKPVEAYLLAIESYAPTGDDAKAGVSGRPRKIADPSGAFLWEDLAPGRYVLAASAAGRPPARSDPIDVESGRTTHHVRIVLQRGAMLSGRVVDADTRAPIEGAQVDLDAVTSSGANAISLVLTDATGTFEMEGVPGAGPFSIRVSHPSYVTKIVPGIDARGTGTVRARDVDLRPKGDGGAREELAGIGAMLVATPRGVVLAGVVDGGPAARAGLQKGDRLVRIDGVDAAEMTLSESIQRLRGDVGTRVGVSVKRGDQAIDVTLQREVVSR